MSKNDKLKCFKAYDVRGKLGGELNEEIAYRIGRAIAQSLKAKTVVLGFDARATSPSLAEAVASGVCYSGADVLDIGLAGTEEIYSAVSAFNADAGVAVTASHNPIDYNGMKIVKKQSQPLSDQEFLKIKYIAEETKFSCSNSSGSVKNKASSARKIYVDKILSFVNLQSLKPLKIVINSGNGAAGPVIDALNHKLKQSGVNTDFVYLHHKPDASFPNGIPNPLLENNRGATAEFVVRERADFGVAFDGDFDRCFLFDHRGTFIPGEYVIGLLSKVFRSREKGAKIVYDPRVIWNTIDVVTKCDGQPVLSKTGHSFVKATMRKHQAIYGGEMSAHHYFRDFQYCDSGMIPWLMIWQLLSESKSKLSDLIDKQINLFPSSGELNFTVTNPAKCLERVRDSFVDDFSAIEELDGLSLSFENWRFNLRKSNTEPLVRLNIETRGDQSLLEEKKEELRTLIKQFAT